MSTPNQPQDPYQAPDGSGQNQPDPGYGQTPQHDQPPQYGQYAPQDPAAQPGAYPTYPTAPQGEPYQATPMYGYPKNNLGVWALVLGVVGLFVCGPAGIAAVVMGGNAKKAVARGEANNGGMATAGIVFGWVTIVLWVVNIIVIATGGYGNIFG